MRAARKPPDADHPVRPSQVRDAGRGRHLRVHAPGGVRDRPLGAEALRLRGHARRHAAHLPRHDRDAGGQHRRRALRSGRGAAAQQRAAPRRLDPHAHATSTRRSACWSRWRASASGTRCWIRSAGSSIAVLIARTGFEIARDTSGILSDRVVIDEERIRQVVMSVPGVLGCHHIRTRGPIDHVFLDLHVWFPADARLAEAHAVSHVVKDRLMAALSADRGRDHPHRATAARELAVGSPLQFGLQFGVCGFGCTSEPTAGSEPHTGKLPTANW